MKTTPVVFPCGTIALEGVMFRPDGGGPFSAAVVCHPHPLYGGSMDNNVVNAVCHALVERSIIALKFNFRGVGRSEGSHSGGNDEPLDLKAAIDYVSELGETTVAVYLGGSLTCICTVS